MARLFDQIFEQSPDSVLDYGFNWTGFLDDGEIIVDSEVNADPPIVITNLAFSDGLVTFYAGGGVSIRDYVISNLITTNRGRKAKEAIVLRVIEP